MHPHPHPARMVGVSAEPREAERLLFGIRRGGRRSAGAAARLLIDGALRERVGLEPAVGNGLSAHDGEPVGPVLEPRLGTLERGELVAIVLEAARVELVLVEALVVLVAWL